jgi:hypothetical protein
MPATRYSRSGNTITIDYDYHGNSFGPFPPSIGSMSVPIGAFAPGEYTVEARLFDTQRPGSGPVFAATKLVVSAPRDWGAYVVPLEPRAFEDLALVIHSAAYFDPRTLRATITGETVRVDFDYLGTTPEPGAAPAGMTRTASIPVGGLAPGAYVLEAWARPSSGGFAAKFFTRDFAVSGVANVVEYYNERLDHYFVAAGPDEVALLDDGGQGGWKRTGQRFGAWLEARDAPLNAHPVCRFYAKGANSHFYTGDARECEYLRDLEKDGRSLAAADGKPFLGWGFEGIAFWALTPQFGQCLAGTAPVYRAYNNRAAQHDSNHRFMSDAKVRGSMAGWIDEGAAFCSAD